MMLLSCRLVRGAERKEYHVMSYEDKGRESSSAQCGYDFLYDVSNPHGFARVVPLWQVGNILHVQFKPSLDRAPRIPKIQRERTSNVAESDPPLGLTGLTTRTSPAPGPSSKK
jgi:hypothetical protein